MVFICDLVAYKKYQHHEIEDFELDEYATQIDHNSACDGQGFPRILRMTGCLSHAPLEDQSMKFTRRFDRTCSKGSLQALGQQFRVSEWNGSEHSPKGLAGMPIQL